MLWDFFNFETHPISILQCHLVVAQEWTPTDADQINVNSFAINQTKLGFY